MFWKFQYVTVDELVETVIEVAAKEIHVKYVEGLWEPLRLGQARNPSTGSGRRFSKVRIHSLGWEAKVSLKEGISRTYPWIETQIKTARKTE